METHSRSVQESRPSLILAKVSRRDIIPVIIILLAIGLSAWIGTRDKANTTDELVHVLAGHVALSLNDYRLNPENGTLVCRIAALPIQGLKDLAPVETDSSDWAESQQWFLGYRWWFKSGMDHRKVFHLSHLTMLAFNLLGLLLVFIWSGHLWGRGGAYFSLILAGFSPNFLGHIPLATSDFLGTWTLVLAILAFVQMLERVRFHTVVLAGITAAVALLCKHSAVIIAPIAGALVLWRILEQRPLDISCFGLVKKSQNRLGKTAWLTGASLLSAAVSVLIIWWAYSWRYSAANPSVGEFTQFQVPWDQLTGISLYPIIAFMREWQLLPEAFLYGLNFILAHGARGGFLNGEYSVDGFQFYHFWTFLYKTPLPAMLLHIIGGSCFVSYLWKNRPNLSPTIRGILILGIVYFLMLWSSQISIGHRHAFVLLYLSTIIAGVSIPWIAARRPRAGIALFVILVSLVPLSVSQINRTISYVNILGGGEERGYQRLADSSLDWGQDLPAAVAAIKAFQEEEPEKAVHLSYFGSAEPESFGLSNAGYLPSWGSWRRKAYTPKLESGLYVIGATAFITTKQEWTTQLEQAYQLIRREADPLYKKLMQRGDLSIESADSLLGGAEVKTLEDFEYLRFQRLKNYLQKRDPEEVLNGSILVFRLGPEELDTF
ncbi:hypothetical protein G0Q06_08325 [Puniceicoccales bacterium CK1056]|uniref:Glycosyltransferase RgtA/B/C/D-like domain-containing protein n=1 Tax=Oceanipulchritudo coccoides TaxID=2706888 RepID=A0A6B2M295_9BACT|nr:glycosyltransferase family 39 protein [Oceanipulchritudo coccoides]NDV62452.1 hypothetical protein [Oceanipulchritudo coccoides]